MTDHYSRAREYASNGSPDAGLIHAILAAIEAALYVGSPEPEGLFE